MKKWGADQAGYGAKDLILLAMDSAKRAREAGVKKSALRRRMTALIEHPQGFFDDPHLGRLARRRRVRSSGRRGVILRPF